MTRDALAFDCAVVLSDKSLRDGEAQAAAALAPRYQRKENLVANRLRTARPVVLDEKRRRQPMPALAQRNAASHARPEADFAHTRDAFQRLGSISDNVEKRLRELFRIGLEFR